MADTKDAAEAKDLAEETLETTWQAKLQEADALRLAGNIAEAITVKTEIKTEYAAYKAATKKTLADLEWSLRMMPARWDAKAGSSRTTYTDRLEPKAGPSEQLTAAMEAACRAMGLASTEEGEASAAESNWGQVLAELEDYSISQTIIQELKDAYEYQGFNARLIVMRMGERGVSELHSEEGAAGAYMDRLTLVVIGLMRGANLDKVRKGMREENKTKLDKLIKHFGLQSKPVDSAAITLPRVIATYPAIAMDVMKVVEVGPVRQSTMTGPVPGYPMQMMFSAFPSLIPAAC
ncbi:N protein, putative [Ixodes scapularis]|uniref:N protein, putative n=1 Tax=Ixodes scapularis TaxID=6945 RepID=B7PZL7_IXOSC|nr:N protein, putative [Ixodes scapularis]|eukprot:XP_002405520.1 N protein, putative [Ixodes scapularis]